ncbi:hypothetical protein NQ317_003989 [Molorchus minor]|uniref:Ribosomal protein S14 n=1 Tax=Molorchus minor TaxID=1323400 RepID=A0ABQ9K1A6_9CUCU|nr:hypothetical protein NQ317_003989 [Molorchus minor]
MSRSVNQVYTKIFKMPKEAKKRRFYRKLNGLNKNCESLIFHNKKEDYETVIRAATINSFMSLKIKDKLVPKDQNLRSCNHPRRPILGYFSQYLERPRMIYG